jgi:radical SAM superfamily enzyme YgiQ (UPF0313 family)
MRTWPLGLACVAAATEKAGHDVRLLDLMDPREPGEALEKAIAEFNPDVIGVSVRNIDDQTMRDTKFLLDEVKDVIAYCRSVSNAPVVIGGAGYSIFPEASLDYLAADMGIVGEGEAVFVELLKRLDVGAELSNLPGLYLRGSGLQGERGYVHQLDELPLPDPSLLPHATDEANGEFWLPVQTRRGCPMNCSYCSTPAIEGRLFRKRSPEIVVDWMGRWTKIGVRRFYFVDNTFNLPPSYAKELCSVIEAAHLNAMWRCIVYPAKLDETLVASMAHAGCKEVSLGFESGSEPILRWLNKRFKLDDVRRAARLFGEVGILRMGFLLLGAPGETKESVLESLAFVDSLDLEAVRITIGIRIYPNTLLARTAVEEGVVAPEDDLLLPRFYIVQGLEEWAYHTVSEWMSARPNWMM